MYRIMNYDGLRDAYKTLNFLTLNVVPKNDAVKRLIVEIKQAVREYFHRKEGLPKVVSFETDGSGYTELIEFPEDIRDMESAEDCFKKEHEITAEPSIYDCTGQAFTAWHKTFIRGNRYMAYHRVLRDV